ncbi:kinesin-like protein KIN-14F [Magnolia sinica]|uniref:kinesin-like protein KIN-14F n=1 Tax=Magnolia sinica TaxID=86752 RepID=UPI002657C78F|nr:kinesin-like protein KIN-14F [Magnolia sinica]
MASDGIFSISMASVVEDVLQQHGTSLSDIDLASRKAEEAASRRYEAAGWLRKMIGVVGAKDLPSEPSEEEFRLGLRNGIILCSVINKVHPGAVPKVVEAPVDSVVLPDGAALSAFQYFENVRNFLVAVQELGLPTFEASDLEQRGKGARVVNCVLALKSYSDWKQTGGNGSWKYGGTSKPTTSVKCFLRKNAEPFVNPLSRTSSMNEKNLSGDLSHESSEMSLNMLVRAALSDKKPEEVPTLVESMLSKVMEEFERRLASQNELVKTALNDLAASGGNKSPPQTKDSSEMKMEMKDVNATRVRNKGCFHVNSFNDEESKRKLLKQQMLFDRQQRDIQELKQTLHITKAGMQFMQMKYSEEFCNLGRHLHGLAHAASGYHKVLEENRKLYNQVQDLKGSIRVYCRVRPFLHGQQNRMSTVDRIDDGNITIATPSKHGKEGRRSFTFNKVFGPFATQDEVFSDTQPLIRSVLDGYNVCIFAYGQTGSGKTYTMSGPKDLTEQSKGVNYRALSDLFLLSEQRRDTFCYDVSVQMIEIYNEQVRDLLVTDGLSKRLEIRNSSQKGLNVPDANLVPVASTSDVIELMNIGQRNRVVGATALNDRSSRSHSCLTVHIQGRDMTSGTVLRGCMHLVDLAGSERVDKSEVTGERLKEAQHINKSLSALGDVIAALAQKNSHVPYRNSKLTQLLQDSLGGQAKTLMFVHISPEADAVGETISTLKFAERVATVELGAARLNKESGDVKELKEQIAQLKAALARKEGESELNTILTPEVHGRKAGGPSPLHSNRQGGGDMSGSYSSHRQPMEDVGNIEVRSNSTMRQKRPSFDLQELLMATNSPPWPDSSPRVYSQKGDDREMGSGEWVDKVMVNKQEVIGDSPLGLWDRNNGPLPDLFFQSCLTDNMRVFPDQQYNKQGSRKESREYEMAMTDDSDELEIGTSDSSEADLFWQYNLPKVNSVTNGGGSRIKKPQPRLANSPDLRNASQPNGPLHSRKLSNGGGPPLNRATRQPSSGIDGKRFSSGGKTGSLK